MKLIITTDGVMSASMREGITKALQSAGVEALVLDGGLKAQGVPESQRERIASRVLAGLCANSYCNRESADAKALDALVHADALIGRL